MNIIRHRLFATLTAAVLGLAVTGSAQADAFASAILEISNFRLLNGANNVYSRDNFATLTGTNDGHATASLNDDIRPALSVSRQITAPEANVIATCAIANCPSPLVDNFFGRLPSPTSGAPGNFGYGDQYLRGAAIDIGQPQIGVLAQTRADASATLGFRSSADSDVGTSTTFQFQLNQTDTMTVAFDALPYAEAYVEAGSSLLSNANARMSWSINIVDLSTGLSVFSYTPEELNGPGNVSRTGGAAGTTKYNEIGEVFHLRSDAVELSGDTIYQITIQHNTLANAQQLAVPEPATLAIMATGLLGMAVTVRRRRR